MDKTIKDVKQFMTVAGQEVKVSPGIPDINIMKLRLALEFEELLEKAKGMGLMASFQQIIFDITEKMETQLFEQGETGHLKRQAPPAILSHRFRDTHEVNLDEVLDACVDQRVVADGTILAFGLGDIFTKGFDLVHENNMSKFIPNITVDEANDIVETYKSGGVEVYIDTVTYEGVNYGVIEHGTSHKVLKPINFIPVELTSILDKAIESGFITEKQSK